MHQGSCTDYSMQKAGANVAWDCAAELAGLIVRFHSEGCLLGVHTCVSIHTHQLFGDAVREGCSTKVADLEKKFGRRC